ncbi:MAG: DUF87 domain-containing protein [Deltaproteobacteria bacterium]|jgi:hypothetical protein|nr:DUF87 domain-containing protein [Deltaproteobacteria bacterium]
MDHDSFDENAVLEALGNADFEGTAKLKLDLSLDVPEVNSQARTALAREIRHLKASRSGSSTLLKPLLGSAGSGKTHLLTWLRGKAMEQGGFFIGADLTQSSPDLFLTLNRAAVDSLTLPLGGARPQLTALLDNLMREADLTPFDRDPEGRIARPPAEIASALAATKASLTRRHTAEALRFKDVVEAVFLLASDEVEDIFRANAFLNSPRPDSLAAFAGLTWLMSFGSFTVLAMDQLDAIVNNFRENRENASRRELVHNLSIDLGSIHDHAFRTLPVLTLLGDAWSFINEVGLRSSLGRFDEPMTLSPVPDAALFERIAAIRLREAYGQIGFVPPYPAWPFPEAFFARLSDQYPRTALRECRRHITLCQTRNRAEEWRPEPQAEQVRLHPPGVEFDEIDRAFKEAGETDPPTRQQDFWDKALASYLECFALEDPAAAEAGLSVVSYPGALPFGIYTVATTSPPAPAMALALTVSAALVPVGRNFVKTMDDALAESNIDRDLPERRLAIIRPEEGTPKTGKSLASLKKILAAGGRFVVPSARDKADIYGLTEVRRLFPLKWKAWALSRRPAGRIALLKDDLAWLVEPAKSPPPTRRHISDHPAGKNPDLPQPRPATPKPLADESHGPAADRETPAGKGLVRAGTFVSNWKGDAIGPALIPIEDFCEHVAILGQSGSGKTVLLRRLIEEAALQGVSSLVFDCAGDLALFAESWPARPEGFSGEDDEKAARFFRDVDVVVWTPFSSSGNLYKPPRLPDLRAEGIRNDKEGFETALDMAVRSVPENFNLSKKLTDSESSALKRALRKLAHGNDEPGLESLMRELKIISEEDDDDKYKKKFYKATDTLLENLTASVLGDPDLNFNGTGEIMSLLDPEWKRPRVTVVNLLVGGSSPDLQCQMVQKILTALYAMVPSRNARRVNGIIAIDEAKEFAPALKTVPCKEIIIKLASMVRKYGYGLILATQHVTGVDHKVFLNFGTKFVGNHSSHASIVSATEFLGAHGDLGLSHLKKGQFYAAGKSLNGNGERPAKVRTSLCLSCHPPNAPKPDKILEIARMSSALTAPRS